MFGTYDDSHIKPLFTEDENKKEKHTNLRKSVTELSSEEIKHLDNIYQQLINTNSFPTLSALENLFNENRITPHLLTIDILKGSGYIERRIPFGIENENISLNYNFLEDMKMKIKNTPPQLVKQNREYVIQRHLYAIREDGTLLRPLINENGISNSEMINWIIEIVRGISITTYPPKKIYFAVHQYYKFIFSDQQILTNLKTIPGGDMINVIYIEDAVYPIIPINIIFNKVLELILFKNQSLTGQIIENEIKYCLTPTLLNTLLYEWYELRKLKAIDYRVLKKQIDQFTCKPSNFVIINGIKEGIDYNDPPSTIFNLDCVPPIYRQIMFDLLCSSPELKNCKSKNEQIEFISKYKNKYSFNVDEIFLNKKEPQKRLLIE
ncbi:hypothetical protein EDI_048600 [Entamoeba dispar SAW760]|uniref:Uncharacterized protein n=1 Tax=Entamoeba dispar (strain ATCC PRA-260 / SAW760) TaxID=370354 RepID=B0ELU3_ENTDS|nr:uncharacterized protein EDI_048600 [Entamoeba dispar SAW760]EDR24503.1 hypothetical protein EDI_048600 [Entamoeba dispar SAW760]|eukprot:EDR24503.1 hypothetical protein EDI_048600 [Entamoeba dispar SAW760]